MVPSSDTNIRIKPVDTFTERGYPGYSLLLMGNPVKWLQGHNVAGPTSLQRYAVLKELLVSLEKIGLLSSDADMVASKDSHLDIARMYRLGYNCKPVHHWLDLAATTSRSRAGTAILKGTTVYWGSRSRRWRIKAYCKYCELRSQYNRKKKVTAQDQELFQRVSKYVDGMLRIELTIKGQELKETKVINDDLLDAYYERLTFNNIASENDMSEKERKLSGTLRATLRDWKDGKDLKGTMEKPTYYRHRQQLLKRVGVDISVAYDGTVFDRLPDDLVDMFMLHFLKEKQEPERPSELDEAQLLLRL